MKPLTASSLGRKAFLFLLLALTCVALRPVGAATAPRYKSLNPVTLSAHLEELVSNPEAAGPDYWQRKPTVAAVFLFSLHPQFTSADAAAVDRLKQGEFTPLPVFPWQPLGVPPPWDVNPPQSATYDSYRHGLEWVAPLVDAYVVKSDLASLQLAQRVITDWIAHNSAPPGSSPYAWNDHATAKRLRVMCWFWEIWRKSKAYDPSFAKLLLASVYQNAMCMAEPARYPKNSNHGLEMDGALLAAAVTFPEFRESNQWLDIAEQRIAHYIATNFSPAGFNLEQAPSYHWMVLTRLGAMVGYLQKSGRQVPPGILEGATRASAVWPYLLRGDNTVALIGDSGAKKVLGWRQVLAREGVQVPAPSPPTIPNPRTDQAGFLLDFDSGYAIFTAYAPGSERPNPDTHAVFRCNSFPFSNHAHYDALSFTLYGVGRDWIVDAGMYNYDAKRPERRYVQSSRAHNVVQVDGEDFSSDPVKLIESGRTKLGDFVTVEHDLKQARHTRTFQFMPPGSIWITDTIVATDGKPHHYAQLFHAAPGLAVQQLTPSTMVLTAPDGKQCVIEQQAPVGEWTVVTGQTEPKLQGWHCLDFGKLEEAAALSFTSVLPTYTCTFTTRISIGGEPASRPATPAPSASPKPTSPAPKPAGPPAPGATPPASSVVAFTDPVQRYVSRWDQRTKQVTLTHRDQGLQCDIEGSADKSGGGQYGGIRLPVSSGKEVRLTLSFPQPKSIRMLLVDGYDQRGQRLMRWAWDPSKVGLPRTPQTYTLTPDRKSGGFVPDGVPVPEGIVEMDVFVSIVPDTHTGFVLHKAEVVAR